VVKEIFRMLVESRAASTSKERLPPIGLEANRKCFEFAIETALDQKIINKRFSVDELFDETTAALGA
jgi:4,5-dihydroxyphthalate decarboxylase